MEKHHKFSLVKCIVRTMYLREFDMHSHFTTNQNYIGADNRRYIHANKKFYKIDETILSNSFLHLNHYVIQSLEWFMKIKSTRGDATTNNNCRNVQYYKNFDNSCSDIDDFELARMV
jgi:hypothetical protein